MRGCGATRWTARDGDTDRSSPAPRHQHALVPVDRAGQLGTLYGARRIDVLRTSDRALAHQRAVPDPVLAAQDRLPLCLALIPRIEVIALGQRDRSRSEEAGLQGVHRTGRITEHAVDAHAVLLVSGDLIRGLAVFPFGRRSLVPADEPWF